MHGPIRIVLVNPTHPGNIGAAARAMKTMGLSRLHLVTPEHFPHADASARASGADDLLVNAAVCDNLEAALSGCALVFGASARHRRMEWPERTPRQAAEEAHGCIGEVAFVFGREHSGLTNQELAHCNALVHIPCDTEFSSLNLAAAVQVIAYELRLASLESPAAHDGVERPADAAAIERFHAHLEETLIAIGFLDPANPRKLMQRLRRLFGRVRLDDNEVNILRGVLTQVQKHLRR
jgi:TrmH family RNA methyltransferase